MTKNTLNFFIIFILTWISLLGLLRATSYAATCPGNLPSNRGSCDLPENINDPACPSFQIGPAPDCTCTCTGSSPSPTSSPPASISPQPAPPGASPSAAAGESRILHWAENILSGLIVFGFLYILVMAPYIAYLFATSVPDNIKKARELLMALIYGLLLLALSTTIVNIVGSDILQV